MLSIRLFIIFNIIAVVGGADDLSSRIDDFNGHWVQFVMRYYGCANSKFQSCNQSSQMIDYNEWNKSRKAAIVLFNLKEKE